MNVTNPDKSLLTAHPVPNMGRIVVAGNPRGGWKLTLWDGAPIPQSLPGRYRALALPLYIS
jgi:hypothetical protein